MPVRPLRPCNQVGCTQLVRPPERYCPAHRHLERERRRRHDEQRGSAAQRGYDARWRRAREAWLREHPLCAECLRKGRVTAATVVDHIVPHRGDPELFWDRSNWQSLCEPCHNAKSARERL